MLARNGAGGGDVRLVQMDVVGDEKIARTDCRGSGSFVEFRAADVGSASSVATGSLAKAFELASAHIFKLNAVGPGGCGSVEVNRNAIGPPDQQACLPCQNGALRQRDAADRNERDDIGSADAGMNALLLREVDQFRCFADRLDCRRNDRCGWSRDGDDGTIVSSIERPVEKAHAFDLHRRNDLADLLRRQCLRKSLEHIR